MFNHLYFTITVPIKWYTLHTYKWSVGLIVRVFSPCNEKPPYWNKSMVTPRDKKPRGEGSLAKENSADCLSEYFYYNLYEDCVPCDRSDRRNVANCRLHPRARGVRVVLISDGSRAIPMAISIFTRIALCGYTRLRAQRGPCSGFQLV